MTLENGSVYTLSYCCHPHSESVQCSCDCHDENSAAKENLNKYHVNIVDGDYVFEADLKLASSEPQTPNVVASTRKSAALSYDKIKELMDRYPLGLRPYFEAQRIRQVNREARSVINVMHGIVDDFYLNLLDWGKLGIIALGSSQNVVLINSADPEAWPITQLNSGNEERPEPENLCTSLKWSPEGDKLAVGIRNGNVQIWDLETRVKVRELNAHMQRVSVIDWAPIDQILTTASRDKSILIHDLRNPDSRAVVATFSRHKQEICGLKWRDPNLHSVDEIRQQSPPDENTPTEESGDQESNVDDDGTRISNLFEDELRRTFSTPARNVSQTKAMAIKTLNSVLNQSSCDATDTMASTFVPGSKPILASGGNDNKVFIWELGYETPIMRLSVHSVSEKLFRLFRRLPSRRWHGRRCQNLFSQPEEEPMTAPSVYGIYHVNANWLHMRPNLKYVISSGLMQPWKSSQPMATR